MATQTGLLAELQDALPAMPEGFRYQEDVISEAEEAALVASLATLELRPFEFHGHVGNRRVTSFGLRYDYAGVPWKLQMNSLHFLRNCGTRWPCSLGGRFTSFSKVASTNIHQEPE